MTVATTRDVSNCPARRLATLAAKPCTPVPTVGWMKAQATRPRIVRKPPERWSGGVSGRVVGHARIRARLYPSRRTTLSDRSAVPSPTRGNRSPLERVGRIRLWRSTRYLGDRHAARTRPHRPNRYGARPTGVSAPTNRPQTGHLPTGSAGAPFEFVRRPSRLRACRTLRRTVSGCSRVFSLKDAGRPLGRRSSAGRGTSSRRALPRRGTGRR